MVCKICNVLMDGGTEYNKKQNEHDKGYKRYNKCPKCHSVIYNNSPNFQEIMSIEMEKDKKR